VSDFGQHLRCKGIFASPEGLKPGLAMGLGLLPDLRGKKADAQNARYLWAKP
jgi:hypothetical protein